MHKENSISVRIFLFADAEKIITCQVGKPDRAIKVSSQTVAHMFRNSETKLIYLDERNEG